MVDIASKEQEEDLVGGLISPPGIVLLADHIGVLVFSGM
jgi:hypothetical protein